MPTERELRTAIEAATTVADELRDALALCHATADADATRRTVALHVQRATRHAQRLTDGLVLLGHAHPADASAVAWQETARADFAATRDRQRAERERRDAALHHEDRAKLAPAGVAHRVPAGDDPPPLKAA